MNKEPETNLEAEMRKGKRQPNGKIARLLYEIRQKLNFRLRNGDDTEKILSWLNGLPETKAILNEKFDGKPISVSNLSDWRLGGYTQWLRHQDTIEETRWLMEEATELGQAGAEVLPERLGILLAARCASLTARLEQGTAMDHEELRLLYRLCQSVALLRRGNQASEWISLENRRVSTLEEKADRKQVELFMKWAQDDRVKRTLEQPELSNQEKLDILGQLMFGEYWNPSWRKWKVEPPYLTNEPPALKREREEEEARKKAEAAAAAVETSKSKAEG
jgi:hypothetical protein